MNKYEQLQVKKMRAKMRTEETLSKFQESWFGQEPQLEKKEEVPTPKIEEVE